MSRIAMAHDDDAPLPNLHDFRLKGRKTMAKYIFVTGGVVSSLGKGLTSASRSEWFSNGAG